MQDLACGVWNRHRTLKYQFFKEFYEMDGKFTNMQIQLKMREDKLAEAVQVIYTNIFILIEKGCRQGKQGQK
jgi:hypothetical protein